MATISPDLAELSYKDLRFGGVDQREQFLQRAKTGGDFKDNILQDTFGLPPENLMSVTNRKIRDTMPICHFIPSQPIFKFGLDLFFIRQAFDQSANSDPSYKDLLQAHGFSTPNTSGQGIKVAYLADNFPTDTFTNEYGENFLQSMTDVASQGAAQISQFFGAKSATEGINKIIGAIDRAMPTFDVLGKEVDIGKGLKGLSSGIGQGARAFFEMTGTQNAANVLNRLAAGARLDFPMVWKSSGFQPSYSLTVRLYNPNPRSKKSTKKYIVGPIVALMLLGVPISQDGSTFSWPYLHKIVSPGIFELNPGFIQNITVIKGGDQQQISQQQHLSMVDVRIDVGSLFSTMVAGTSVNEKTRPTVRKYLNNMLQQGNSAPVRHQIYDRRGIAFQSEAVKYQKSLPPAVAKGESERWAAARAANRPPSAGQAPTKTESTGEPTPRVTQQRQERSEQLNSESPSSYGSQPQR